MFWVSIHPPPYTHPPHIHIVASCGQLGKLHIQVEFYLAEQIRSPKIRKTIKARQQDWPENKTCQRGGETIGSSLKWSMERASPGGAVPERDR